MRLASHNSWSFLPPLHWWQRMLSFTAKCQRLSISEQLEAGVTCFDLRLFYNKHQQQMELRHGIFVYCRQYSILFYLRFLNSYAGAAGQKLYVRVLLEQNSISKDQELIERQFVAFCTNIISRFTNLIFFYGLRKFDNKVVYPFKDNIDLPIMELYSSVTTISGPQSHKWYARLDDLFPRLYAFLHNKHLLNKYRDAPVTLMLDFIKK